MPPALPYALVFPAYPFKPSWNRFWTSLLLEATTGAHFPGRAITPYFGLNGQADEPDHQRLLEDLRQRRLGGIIFASNPFPIADTPIVRGPGPVRVGMMRHAGHPTCLEVHLSDEEWSRRALEDLAKRGRRRVAVLTPANHYGNARLPAEITRRRLELVPGGLRALTEPREALDAARELLRAPADVRPDALLITDDNFADYGMMGVHRAGIAPDELDAVVHCNFPWSNPTGFPVRRLGFSAQQVLATCIDVIELKRRGEAVPELTELPALFEDELPD